MNNYGPSAPYFVKVNEAHSNWFKFFYENRYKMGDTILNVGLSISAVKAGEGWVDWFLNELIPPFKKLYILELYKPYADYFSELYANNNKIEIIHGDVREASKYIKNNVDTTFWFHGPEHIPKEDLPKAFIETNKITNKAIFWMGPWGHYYGLYCGENEPDNHHYYPEDEDFTQLGFDIIHSGGEKHTGSANINAYIFK
jgi:hypothetical protein